MTGSFTGISEPLQIVLAGAVLVILVLISVEDIKTMTISDRYSIALFLAALVDAALEICAGKSGVSAWKTVLSDRAAGAVMISGAMAAVNAVRRLAGKTGAFGGGDVLLCFSAGALLGLPKMTNAAAIAMAFSGVFAAAGVISGKLRRDSAFPLGPFLAFGIACSLIF